MIPMKGYTLMKKHLMITLLAAMVLLSTSCGDNVTEMESHTQSIVTETAANTEINTEAPYYDTEGIDYNGYSFRIWNYDRLI